jgi:hypothetical protein
MRDLGVFVFHDFCSSIVTHQKVPALADYCKQPLRYQLKVKSLLVRGYTSFVFTKHPV